MVKKAMVNIVMMRQTTGKKAMLRVRMAMVRHTMERKATWRVGMAMARKAQW